MKYKDFSDVPCPRRATRNNKEHATYEATLRAILLRIGIILHANHLLVISDIETYTRIIAK